MDTIITNLHVHRSRGNRTSINVSLSVHSFNIAPPKISIPTVASAVASVPPARYAAMSPRDQGSDETLSFFTAKTGDVLGDLRGGPRAEHYTWSEMGPISDWDLGVSYNPYKVELFHPSYIFG